MKPIHLRATQFLPAPIENVFPFFADAHNLETITPPWMRFAVLNEGDIEMGEGTTIDYRLRFRGLPLRWRTLITAWDPPHRFEDVQQRGPYRLWRHEHTFEPHDGGTLIGDNVAYAAPLGRLIEPWLVRPDVRRVFAFRQRKLAELFGEGETSLDISPSRLDPNHP